MESRVKDINRFRDPTTNADEVLRAAKVVLAFLLFLTAVMAAFAYARNFSSFPTPLAWSFAIGLAAAIEFGKNYCATWAIRTPFFLGWGHLRQAPENTLRWLSLLLVALVTFAASIYNSTKGAKQISSQLAYEAQYSAFTPNTADIDAQLQAAEKRIARNNSNTWKGQVVWASQKANAVEARNIENLQKQRAARIEQQRADWEKEQAAQAENRDYASNMVLAAGGWIEVLQVLLMFLRVSCEKSLNTRMVSESPTPSSIGFRSHGSTLASMGHTTPPGEQRRPIGFHRAEHDAGRHSAPSVPQHGVMGISVPQSPQSVPQTKALLSGKEADEAILYHLGRLQKEPGNFDNKHAVASTVAKRVHTILDDLERTLGTLSECSLDVAERTATYIIDKIQPKLQEHDQQHDLTNIITMFRQLVGIQDAPSA